MSRLTWSIDVLCFLHFFCFLWLKFTLNDYQPLCNMAVAEEFIRCEAHGQSPEDTAARQWPAGRYGRSLTGVPERSRQARVTAVGTDSLQLPRDKRKGQQLCLHLPPPQNHWKSEFAYF